MARYVEGLGGDIVVGQIPLAATVLAGSGFVILVFLRSRLRLGGIVLIGLGAALALPPLKPAGPDILVSEDGSLVALAGPGGLASNAARPNEFVFRQWQTALGDRQHVAPVTLDPDRSQTVGVEAGRTATKREGPEATEDREADREGASTQMTVGEYAQTRATDKENGNAAAVDGNDAQPAVDPKIFDRLLAAAAADPSRFHCAGRGVCAAIHQQAHIVAISDAALIGAACDRADLVVVAIPVHMRFCRSGATLVTARSLRTSGALAIRIAHRPQSPERSGESQRSAQANASQRRTDGDRVRSEFAVTAALGGIIRPWTIQRYFDWRSRSYDLPE